MTDLKGFTLASALCGLASAAGAQSAAQVAAETELQTLANQMALVQMDTLWFTTLENLDDLSSETTTNPFDWINHNGGALVVDPITGRFGNPRRMDLVNRPEGLRWQGPYVAYQQSRIDGPDSVYDEGTPLDPWGTPYFFYTPLGLIDPRAEAITLDGYGDEFHLYTLVSLGPDGIVSSDDLTRSIPGFFVQVPAVSSVRVQSGDSRRAAWVMRIKGYNFGATQGSGNVLINDVPIAGPIVEWTSTLITAELDTLPPAGSTFTVQTDGGATPSIEGFIVEGETAVRDWMMY